MLRTQKLTFLNSDFFAKSEIQNIITISKIMKLVQKLNSQQQIEHGGHFYCRHGYSMGIFNLFLGFIHFFMLFNGNHAIFMLFVNFPYYSMGGLHFVNFPCYSMGIGGLRDFWGGDRQMGRRT